LKESPVESALIIIAITAVTVGTFFSVVGVLGYIRLPDIYTRLHATGMVSVFGVALFLAAAAFWTPMCWGKALVLICFLLATAPPTAHAMGSAAYRIGLPRKQAQRDDLADTHAKAMDT